jgi:hypothetical protein
MGRRGQIQNLYSNIGPDAWKMPEMAEKGFFAVGK